MLELKLLDYLLHQLDKSSYIMLFLKDLLAEIVIKEMEDNVWIMKSTIVAM